MKQVIQPLKTGTLLVSEVPAPGARAGNVLVQTAASLVSAGTERMVVDFAEKSLLQKAKSRPDLVKQTLDKSRREGLLTTLDAVRNRLEQPMALGYSCAGTILEVGSDVVGFKVGDRVACAGAGYANHAEIVSVPKNLSIPLPDDVSFEAAAFTTMGAIALQGIRLADVKLGEVVAVIGLGLLGQLTVQMLKAAGCVVVGLDIQLSRAELARQLGADATATTGEEFIALTQQFSLGHGTDGVLITADTKSNEPVEVAGEVAREKGVVVAVGAVGMQIPRKIYYEKELDFRVSRSYGPGRYDPEYEEKGHDYPYGYVRWTEGRNMRAFAQVLRHQVKVEPLITHRFSIEDAPRAYDLISGKTEETFLGVLLTYPDAPNLSRTIHLSSSTDSENIPVHRVALGVLGAGLFANATLLPALKGIEGVERIAVASGRGLSAQTTAQRFGFAQCTTDASEILQNSDINTVAILTRHNLHARQVVAALDAGKNIFVEKPLCLDGDELQTIITAHRAAGESNADIPGESAQNNSAALRAPTVMVGFNRRFAPFVIELKSHLQEIREPLFLNYRVNAGYIPPDHWVHDPAQGGGRLRGEACHFIDLIIHLAGDAPQRVTTHALPESGRYSQDNLLITIEFLNGSLGQVIYASNGDKRFGKEHLEVFGGGLSARLDDYRSLLIAYGDKQVKREAKLRQDKGHRAEWQAFVSHLLGQRETPIPWKEIIVSTRATLAAYRSLQSGRSEMVDENSEDEE